MSDWRSRPRYVLSGLSSARAPCEAIQLSSYTKDTSRSRQNTLSSCHEYKRLIKQRSLQQTINTYQRFYPAQSLRDIWNKDAIQELLACNCEGCLVERDPSRDDVQVSDYVLRGAVQLLSLLVFIDHAQLIQNFFECDISDFHDVQDLDVYDNEQLCTSVWPGYTNRDHIGSAIAAQDFGDHKYRFFLPAIRLIGASEAQIPKFSEAVLLPFVNEQRLGPMRDDGHISQEGGFSTVYSFAIAAGYDQLQIGQSRLGLVRKEVMCSKEGLDTAELTTLMQVQNLEEVNIVRLLSAYYHGDKLNLIFRRTRTNLHDYLRCSQSSQVNGLHYPFADHHLWSNMLDVLEALYRLSDGIDCKVAGRRLRGFHFDMKPANILVDDTDGRISLLIADFGFARFADRSKLLTQLGAGPYAPPEASKFGFEHHRNYDVWSVGCILLDVLAFVLGGATGVLELDEVRYTEIFYEEDGGSCFSDEFWRHTVEGTYEVKPEVIEWLNRVTRTEPLTSHKFLTEVKQLIMRMLDVNVDTRPSAEESYNRLRYLLISQRPPPNYSDDQISMVSEDDRSVICDEFELASELMATVGSCSCKIGHWFREGCRVRIFEGFTGSIHVIAASNEGERHFVLESRAFAMLTPRAPINRYEGTTPPGHHNAINITFTQRGKADDEMTIHLSTGKDVLILQSVLLGQRLLAFSRGQGTYTTMSLPLESVMYIPAAQRGFSLKSSRKPPKPVLRSASAMQVWRETCHMGVDERQILHSPQRPARVSLGRDLLTRIIFYCHDCLIILRLAKNERLRKPTPKANAREHAIIPTDAKWASMDRTFAISVLPSKHGASSCPLPLDPEAFSLMEANNSVECDSLAMNFRNGDEAEMFRLRYNKSKQDWQEGMKELQRSLKLCGEKRGWEPAYLNTRKTSAW